MKRLVSIFIVILFCLALAVPALAAERYEFYPVPMVLSEFNRLEGKEFFISDSIVDSGTYTFSCVLFGQTCVSEPFTLDFSNYDDGLDAYACYVDLIAPVGDVVHVIPVVFLQLGDYGTAFACLDENGNQIDVLPELNCFVLAPVSYGLGSVVTGDLMHGVLDQLVSLLPVVLAVIVGCIGLRKAISWLLNMIRSS